MEPRETGTAKSVGCTEMAASKPFAWKPRLLPFDEAASLYELHTQRNDQAFSKKCFELLSEREHGVIAPMSPLPSVEEVRDWALFVAAGIAYRRCFTSGARKRLESNELNNLVGEELAGLHSQLLSVIDKHVAHDVNAMAIGSAVLYVGLSDDNELRRGNIGYNGAGAGAFGPKAYARLVVLTSIVIEKLIEPKILKLEDLLQQKISSMSDEEISQLPEGFAPHIESIQYNKRRAWPPRGSR